VKPLFALGHVVATPGALAAIEKSGQQPAEFLARHASSDWGELDPGDIKENELSLQHGFRLLSAYDNFRVRDIHPARGTKAYCNGRADLARRPCAPRLSGVQ
jgi:hypothetical protein